MEDSAWNEVSAAIAAAPYPVQILPADPVRSAACQEALGFSTRSWLGAVVANAGGLLIDHGWLRVLGSGHDGLPDLASEADPATGLLIVGYDILGGQFAWLPAEPGAKPTVHYFAPDELSWQDLEQGYSDWLEAMLAGSVTGFYETLRWPGWPAEAEGLGLDQGISAYPPPWSEEGRDLSAVSRRAVPLAELVDSYHDAARQLEDPHQS